MASGPFNDAQIRFLLQTIQQHPPPIDGIDGPQGDTGPQGPQGSQGDSGLQGPQGPRGVTGAPGGAGRDGTNGSDGEDGSDGPRGFQGPEGPQGPKGAKGPKGDDGPEGPQGPAGKNGSPGGAGMMGVQGPQGPAGGGSGGDSLQGPTIDIDSTAGDTTIDAAGGSVRIGSSTNTVQINAANDIELEADGGMSLVANGGDIEIDTGAGDLIINGQPYSPGGGVNVVTVDLTAEQIAVLASGEVELVDAQGPGTWIVPVSASFQFKSGTSPFANPGDELFVASSSGHLLSAGAMFDKLNSFVLSFAANPFNNSQSSVENLPLEVYATTDPEFTGDIDGHDIGNPGSGYEIGDDITVDVHDTDTGVPAVLTVDTVDVGGEVLSYHISTPGANYIVGQYAQTSTTGIGEDFALSVDSITPTSDGTARVTVIYYVMTLL